MNILEFDNFVYWIRNATCREIIEAFKRGNTLHNLIIENKEYLKEIKQGRVNGIF